ncbi:MAG: T9SS type A sorting domain-containing protein [Bacteroidota bacterium]|nr:T9SS type A sorting domain-containing protein [Bacteroidota bacterium]
MKKALLLLSCLALLLSSTALLQAQTFVGSDECKLCHTEKYDDWAASGHPYKFTIIENGQPPVYPPQAINYQNTWMDSLGDGSHSWNDIAGVIGGYGWKTRFVGTDGHLIGTANSIFPDAGYGHNQINFYGGVDYGWVNYHPTDEKIYNYGCFKCHTTGGDTNGTWLTGVTGLGNFSEGGVGCESCHGPGSEHIAAPTEFNIDKVYEFAHQDNALGGLSIGGVVDTPDPNRDDINFLCGTCHNRDYTDPINSSGGFIKHHEQWDEFVTTAHYADGEGMDCKACHNPHKRVIWDGDGITKNCELCHPDQAAVTNHSPGATCIDCHMPFAAKSGTTRGQSGYKADVRSHLFKIIADTNSMFVADGSVVKDDDERPAALSPHYACLGCHNDDPDDNIPNKEIGPAAAAAKFMHSAEAIQEPEEIVLGVYPNPSHGPTRINFNLPNAENISLKIYNAAGQMVYAEENIYKPAGDQVIRWDGTSNTRQDVKAGYYFVQVSAGNITSVVKLVMMN